MLEIKEGTIGIWNTPFPANYTAKPGARVVVTETTTGDSDIVNVKWIDALAGTQMDGGYFTEDFDWIDPEK